MQPVRLRSLSMMMLNACTGLSGAGVFQSIREERKTAHSGGWGRGVVYFSEQTTEQGRFAGRTAPDVF